MTCKILTTIASVAALVATAVPSFANDGFTTCPSRGCGCSTNGIYSNNFNYPNGYSTAGGCLNGNCGYPNSTGYYAPAPSGFRGNYSVPLTQNRFPRQTAPPSTSPFFDSRSPYNDSRNRQPAFQSIPSFGTGEIRPALPNAVQAPSIPAGMEGIAQLSATDQVAALRQRTCPVTKEPLGSMGKPIRVSVGGQSIFVCCEGCVAAVKRNPDKYLRGASTRQHSIFR